MRGSQIRRGWAELPPRGGLVRQSDAAVFPGFVQLPSAEIRNFIATFSVLSHPHLT